jgi:ssDNA-binding Zn-finger/Zn-ribbon topoisomerase 1
MLVRCENHPSKDYVHAVEPVGYPETAAVCGRCEKEGRILLSEKEWRQYLGGQRVFAFKNNTMKVKAKPSANV